VPVMTVLPVTLVKIVLPFRSSQLFPIILWPSRGWDHVRDVHVNATDRWINSSDTTTRRLFFFPFNTPSSPAKGPPAIRHSSANGQKRMRFRA